ncbi:TonB-dependent receptor domain-containing protein [Pedobacter sp. SL55]|uniref:TonB-dependent receptor domain-containing protein n=1 Tax=Pedobacter sp. SL55 TaxID=2995161 RepID=UPI00227133B0|nr:TonB-dependent receptor [Pedobacter sp. SL55]WAC41859.1 TonB-dependent receptor [Pedobacter sp. SL55]
MKKIYLLMIAFLTSISLLAEANRGKQIDINGTVLDEQRKPIDYATVGLFKASDSSLVKTAMTTPEGKFSFPNIVAGSYYIKINMMGYQIYKGKSFVVGETVLNLPDILLKADSKTLNTVSVTAVKPLLERKADKMVMNVENSSVAVGSSALEVLQRAPGVTVDQNDRISMQGKQGVLIMLDGKQTYMSQADVANLLRNMQSSEIETIELITNPSSKYDAAGNSGIINIKTKRAKNGGANGSFNAGTAYGKNPRGNTGLNLNYRNKGVNVFGSYNFNKGARTNVIDIDRIANATATSADTYFSQKGGDDRDFENNNFKVGADFFLNKNNTIGVLATGYLNSASQDSYNKTNIGKSFNQLDSILNTTNLNTSSYRNFAYNLNYKSVLDTTGQELTFDADYSKYKGNDRSDLVNTLTFADGSFVKPIGRLRNNTPSTINIRALKVDYSLPINKTTKLEAGAKSSWVETDNDLKAEEFVGSAWQNDERRSNRFVYDENVNAVYTNLSKQFKKTSVQLGLRMEQTNSKGHLITTNNMVERSYWDFFPTIYVQQTLSKNHQLGASHGRRIDRPSYDALNPFVFYLDEYTYNQGNPFLKPQYTNNYEVNYTFMQRYFLNLGYSVTNDAITEVILPNEERKALFQTNENLATQKVLSANLTVPVKIKKWWSMSNNLNVFHMAFETPNLNGQALKTGQTSYQFRMQNNFIIMDGLTAELNANYESPLTYGTLDLEERTFIDFGISKAILKKKGSLKFAVSDVFDTNRTRLKSAYPGLSYNLYQKNETQLFRLNFTYRFGKNEIKPARRRSTGTEAEQGRMKN